MSERLRFDMDNKDGIVLATKNKYCDHDIKVVPKLEDKTVTENGTYPVPDGYAGHGEITVDVQPPLESITIDQGGTYTRSPSEGAYGFDKVDVDFTLGGPTELRLFQENGKFTIPNRAFQAVKIDVPRAKLFTVTTDTTCGEKILLKSLGDSCNIDGLSSRSTNFDDLITSKLQSLPLSIAYPASHMKCDYVSSFDITATFSVKCLWLSNAPGDRVWEPWYIHLDTVFVSSADKITIAQASLIFTVPGIYYVFVDGKPTTKYVVRQGGL